MFKYLIGNGNSWTQAVSANRLIRSAMVSKTGISQGHKPNYTLSQTFSLNGHSLLLTSQN